MNTTVTTSETRRVATAYALRPGWLALAAVAVVAAVAGDLPLAYQYVPLIASVFLMGLPHGAVDHLLLARQRDTELSMRSLAAVGGVYVGFGGAYALLWFVWPVGAFVGFILLTWFHWGQGELYPLHRLVGASYLDAPGQRTLTVAVRGGAPMLVPLVAFPDQYEFVATTLVGLFDTGAAAAVEPAFELRARLAVGALYWTLLVVTAMLGYLRTTELRPWLVDAGELLGLTAYFLVVPPVLAIGVYFCFWHSLRHVVRTVLLHERSVRALDRQVVWPTVWQFARDAAPLTGLSLVVLGGLAVLLPRSPTAVPELVGLYLVFVAVLTLPHVVIVTLLDRRQSVL